MAFGTTGAGTITKEQTLLSIRRLPIHTSTTLTKGNVVEPNSAGDLIVSPTARTREISHYVCLETTIGTTAGVIFCPVAVPGHYVTVIADAVIEPGERVIISGSTAAQVVVHVTGTDEHDEVVGTYFGKESGTIATGGSTPFLESFTDTADFSPVACADGDVIEILLGVA